MNLARSLLLRTGIAVLLACLLIFDIQGESTEVVQNAASDAVANRQKLLDEEASEIAKESQELNVWRVQEPNRAAELLTRKVSQAEVDQATLAAETAKVTLESILLDITAAEQTRKELTAAIKTLNDKLQQISTLPEAERDQGLTDKTKAILEEKQRLLELEQKHSDQLAQRKKLAQDRLTLTEKWRNELRESFKGQAEQALQESLDELDKQLSRQRSAWQDKLIKFRERANQLKEDPDTAPAEQDFALAQLVEAEESIFLLGNQLKLAQINTQLQKSATGSAEVAPELSQLKSKADELDQLKDQLNGLADLLKSKQGLLKQRRDVVDKRKEMDSPHQQEYREVERILARLIDEYATQLRQIAGLLESVSARIEVIDAAIEGARLLQTWRRSSHSQFGVRSAGRL